MKRLSFLLLLLTMFAAPALHAQTDTPPQALNLDDIRQKIGYPAEAKVARIDGKVVAKVVVDEKGKVATSEIIESPSDLLSHAVTDRIKDLKFEAAKKDGQAVRSIVHVPFMFELPAEKPVYTSQEEAIAAGLSVVELDLSAQNLSDLDPRIASLKNLRIINLDDNKFTKFPSELTKLPMLEEISITGNQLEKLPGSLKKLDNLQAIDIRDNQFSKATIRKIREMLENVDEVLAD